MTPPQAVREFLSALLLPGTYNVRRNQYLWFGFLWGVPVPLFSIGLDLYASGQAFGPAAAAACVARHPVHAFFIAHPVLFAIVFGAMGTIRRQKVRQIKGLVRDLQAKVREVEEANQRLKELDALKAEFVANVTHELRTPLVAVLGSVEMVLTERLGPITEKQRAGLERALRGVERELGLVNRLLEVARLEGAHGRFEKRPVDLAGVARTSVDLMAARAQAKGIALSLVAPAGLPRVLGDVEGISEVFANLIGNALKFTEAGGRVDCVLSCHEGGAVQVEVRDTGCGIPPVALGRIFDRFSQVDPVVGKRKGGVGLGLAIVRAVLAAHGTSAEVESEPGKGSVFRFRLPPVGEGAGGEAAQQGLA